MRGALLCYSKRFWSSEANGVSFALTCHCEGAIATEAISKTGLLRPPQKQWRARNDINCVRISRSDDPDKGIQRIASKERLTEIALFVEGAEDVVFPNNLVINFNKNEKVIFRPDKDKQNEGELIIPRKSKIAQVIDGQHRLLGMGKAKKKIHLIVVAFQGLSHHDQAKIFLTINSKQKGINTSLVYDLL